MENYVNKIKYHVCNKCYTIKCILFHLKSFLNIENEYEYNVEEVQGVAILNSIKDLKSMITSSSSSLI